MVKLSAFGKPNNDQYKQYIRHCPVYVMHHYRIINNNLQAAVYLSAEAANVFRQVRAMADILILALR